VGRVVTINLTIARAEALFASTLSSCEPHDRAELVAAIAAAVHVYRGVAGCAAVMAAEFGEHPEQAAKRMQWACECVLPLARHGAVAPC
jgi:hypothetical protein